MKILIINSGSSSVKYQLINTSTNNVLCKGLIEKIGEDESFVHHTKEKEIYENKEEIPDHSNAFKRMVTLLMDQKYGPIHSLNDIDAVGHRVVHGGEKYSESILINEDVINEIRKDSKLAPLHNPPNLKGILSSIEMMPDKPQVAVFDTSFHQTIPPHVYTYGLPYDFYKNYGIRKYGFHGTSHKYVAIKAAEFLNKPLENTNLITCHLGNGASITAIKEGRSYDTSMGFTPVEGLLMGTRSGDIDPAILIYLENDLNYSMPQINNIINKNSGLLGISGYSNDMRKIVKKSEEGDFRAKLAFDIFCYRVKKYIGAYMFAIGTVDAIVFTAGIGENCIPVRESSLKGLEEFGIIVDKNKNRNLEKGIITDISAFNSKIRILVIPTNEELMIAKETETIVKNLK